MPADSGLQGGLSPAGGWELVRVDEALLAPGNDASQLGETVARLHRAWANRQPVLVELDLPPQELAGLRLGEVEERPAYLLGAEFTLLRERLQFLLWRNNYDARGGEPVWWWARKAARLGARPGGRADVLLADGTEAWLDGGPRQPLDLAGVRTVHAESLELGRLKPQPPPTGATGDGPSLAPDQRAAVQHARGPVRVIAPAGSGKTRTLNARLLHLIDDRGVEPSLVCAVAYNNRAAEEMRQRLGRPELRIRTIHSLGWRIVRDVRPDATLLDEREVRSRLQRLLPHSRRAGTDTLGPYVEALSDVRIALQPPERVEAERNDVPGFAGIFDRYRAGLADLDECDYDEQVYEAIGLLLAHPDLRTRWQGRCRHLLVDEFQDLTPAYLLMLRLLASPELNVFGVGDDDQTIYGYAGADPGFLLDYERLFPGAGEAALEVSYRCPAAVVTAVGHLLVNNRRRLPKTVRSAGGHPEDPNAAATLGGPGGSSPGPAANPATGSGSGIEIVEAPDEAMATRAAEIVTAWRAAGVADDSIAVLGRVNSMLLPALAALDGAGVATRCTLGTSLLHRNLVRATLAWMRLALAPGGMDPRDLAEAARRPGRKINRLSRELLEGAFDLSLEQLAGLGSGLSERHRDIWDGFVSDVGAASRLVAGGCDSRALLEFLMQEVGLGRAAGSLDSGRTRPDRAAHADDLLALRRTAAVYSDPAGFGRSLAGLLRRSGGSGDPGTRPAQSERNRDQGEMPGGGVLLTTIHRVKGLEWDRVLVFAADEALLPHQLSSDTEEERRVMHVAVTRCRTQVVVLADRNRPSRFLEELRGHPTGPHPGGADSPGAKAERRRPAKPTKAEHRRPAKPTKAEHRRPAKPAGAEEPYDEELFEALRQWRLRESRRLEVRAFHVFGNRVLRNIARAAPATPAELAEVSGVGPAKLAKYGEAALEVIRLHRAAAGRHTGTSEGPCPDPGSGSAV